MVFSIHFGRRADETFAPDNFDQTLGRLKFVAHKVKLIAFASFWRGSLVGWEYT